MTFARKICDRILAPFDLRLVRASKWRRESEERRRLESLAASSVAQARILRLGNLLLPRSAVGHSKVRLGSRYDGGYICVNDFDRITTAFSFGIGENDDWDIDIAEKGIVVHQFDHTVARTPHTHSNCQFQRTRIGSASAGAESIAHLLAKRTNCAPGSLILKIDVDNDEWEIFSEAADEDLAKFSQIICEFHAFSAVVDDEWFARALAVFEKLNRNFAVVHIHGNNFLPLTNIGNVPFPELLEVTYANRSRYEFESTDEIFPTSLDAPNDLKSPDLFLGRFAFLGGR
jgi:hypothetical protein